MFIVSAARTAFGTFGGTLKNHSSTELATHAAKGAVAAAGISAEDIDTVVFGNVAQTSHDAAYLARHVGLHAGVPIASPALTVNRLCGSGFQAIVSAGQEFATGDGSVALVGGTESMSQAPMALYGHKVRFQSKLLGVDLKLTDTLWSALTDSYNGLPMGITAENLAEQYGISREDCDAFAARSQATWGAAKEAGSFDAEIVGMEVKGRKGPVVFDTDEHPRPATDAASLAKLPSVFKKGGTVTAGNASGICDGAAALVVATEEAVGRLGVSPLARVVSWAVAGVPPEVMGIGPCPAIRQALDRAGLKLEDMALVEINEAFAAQVLACEKELGIDRDIFNTCGGAIALGHPLGASGARIMTHLSHKLRAVGGKYAIGSACIGGGQGIAIIIENPDA